MNRRNNLLRGLCMLFLVLALPSSAKPQASRFLTKSGFTIGSLQVEDLRIYRVRLLAVSDSVAARTEQVEIAIQTATVSIGPPGERSKAQVRDALVVAEFTFTLNGELTQLRVLPRMIARVIPLTPPTVAGGSFKTESRGHLIPDVLTFRADGQHSGTARVEYVGGRLAGVELGESTSDFTTFEPIALKFDLATADTGIVTGGLRPSTPPTAPSIDLRLDSVGARLTEVELQHARIVGDQQGGTLVADELSARSADAQYLPDPQRTLLPIAHLSVANASWRLSAKAIDLGKPTSGNLVLQNAPEAILDALYHPNRPDVLVATGSPDVKFISSKVLWGTYRTLAASEDDPGLHRVVRLGIDREAVTSMELVSVPIAGELQSPPMTTFGINVDEFPRDRPDPMKHDLPKAAGLMVRHAVFPLLVRHVSAPAVIVTFLTISNPILATGAALSIVGATYLTSYAADYTTRGGVKLIMKAGASGALYVLTAPGGSEAPPYPPIPTPTVPGTGDVPTYPQPSPMPHPTPDAANAARFAADRSAAGAAMQQAPSGGLGTPFPPDVVVEIERARIASTNSRHDLVEKDAIWRVHRDRRMAALANSINVTETARAKRIMEVDGVSAQQSERTAAYERAAQARIKQQSGQFVGGPPAAPGMPGWNGGGSGGHMGGPPTSTGRPGVPGGNDPNVPQCQSINEFCYRRRR